MAFSADNPISRQEHQAVEHSCSVQVHHHRTFFRILLSLFPSESRLLLFLVTFLRKIATPTGCRPYLLQLRPRDRLRWMGQGRQGLEPRKLPSEDQPHRSHRIVNSVTVSPDLFECSRRKERQCECSISFLSCSFVLSSDRTISRPCFGT